MIYSSALNIFWLKLEELKVTHFIYRHTLMGSMKISTFKRIITGNIKRQVEVSGLCLLVKNLNLPSLYAHVMESLWILHCCILQWSCLTEQHSLSGKTLLIFSSSCLVQKSCYKDSNSLRHTQSHSRITNIIELVTEVPNLRSGLSAFYNTVFCSKSTALFLNVHSVEAKHK